MNTTAILILAAGLGKRMGGKYPKVLAQTRSKTLIEHVLQTSAALDPEKIVVVTGYGREETEKAIRAGGAPDTYAFDKILFAFQAQQLGTGHAVKSALDELADFQGTVCILYGDIPLVKTSTLKLLLETHQAQQGTLTLIALKGDTTNDYGRVVRDDQGRIKEVVELKDCSPEQRLIDETNSGIYAVEPTFLQEAVNGLTNDNAQGEYYLTDIVATAYAQGHTVGAVSIDDPREIQGVNTLHDLALVNRSLLDQRIRDLLDSGVLLTDPASLYIDDQVEVAPGARIGPQVVLTGKTRISADVMIEGSAYLKDTVIHQGALLKFCVRTEDTVIGAGAVVGPFAHLRPGSVLGSEVKVGNFVETKKAHLEQGAKASHLTYLGDCSVGAQANIGAGTITCNYDGYSKYQTKIGAKAFIGSNTALVAPVEVGPGATIGAGSVITGNVEADSLAITRAKLKKKKNWSKQKREKAKKDT